MVDEGSRKHVAVRLAGSDSAARIRQAYLKHWQQSFGTSKEVVLDASISNTATMLRDAFSWDETRMAVIAEGAH